MTKNKNLWSLLILLFLIAVTLFYLLRDNELGQLIRTASQINAAYLAAGLLFMFVFVAAEGIGIQVLLDSLGYKSTFPKCLKYSFLGFYYCSITPASGGQPVQVYYMNKDGIEVGNSSLCIMIITVAYQIGILLICLCALILNRSFIMSSLGTVKYFSISGAAIDALLIFIFTISAFRTGFLEKAISAVVRVLAKAKIIKKPDAVISRIKIQLRYYRQGALYVKSRPGVLLLTLMFIIIQILSRLSVTYAVYKSFGLQGYGYLDILSLQAFLALGIEYLPIPGSVGAAEAGFCAVNRKIFGSENLLQATLLTRGISFYAFLVISGAVSVFAHLTLLRGRSRPGIENTQGAEKSGMRRLLRRVLYGSEVNAILENRKKILVADDNEEIREFIRVLLESEGYEIDEAADGEEAVNKTDGTVDLIILDVMMPAKSGFKACMEMREKSKAPILFLTAKTQDSDKALGLSLGGDDYMSKPFSYTELVSRVKALLRRYYVYQGKETEDGGRLIAIGDLKISAVANQVFVKDREVLLTDIEYRLLVLMAKNRNKIFSAQNLYESVWNEPYFYSSSNTVMAHIKNMRKKLGDDTQNPRIIKTVWGKRVSD